VVDVEDLDAVIVVFVPPLQRGTGDEVAHVVRSVAATSPKPVLSTFLGFEGVPEALSAGKQYAPARGSVPSYPSPERAVRALARAARYAKWRSRPPGVVPDLPNVDLDVAREFVHQVLLGSAPAGRELTPDEAGRLVASIGIVVSFERPAETVEVELSVFDDRSFGALVSFGVGGVATELLGDTAYAAVPLTTQDADDLIFAPRASPLLTGYHGSEPSDTAALADLALRLSALSDALPEVAECRLSAWATPVGAHVFGVSARVATPTARADSGPRRLRGF
jgi:acyl-CoA synthetase (NDP forming)